MLTRHELLARWPYGPSSPCLRPHLSSPWLPASANGCRDLGVTPVGGVRERCGRGVFDCDGEDTVDFERNSCKTSSPRVLGLRFVQMLRG